MKSTVFNSLLGVCSLLAFVATPLHAGTWTPPGSLTNPSRHLALYNIGRSYCDSIFDPDEDLVLINGGYEVRSSAYYAYGLMLANNSTDLARAEAILQKVVQAQQTNNNQYHFTVGVNHVVDTFGTFKWNFYDDENGNTSNSATGGYDVNAGVFVGATLADIIYYDNAQRAANSTFVLDNTTRSLVLTALNNAVTYAVELDMQPDYTNIAMLSASVGAAGQALGLHSTSGAWAQTKLQQIYDEVDSANSSFVFYEYFAPTYYGVDLKAAYNCSKFSFSSQFGTLASNMITKLWTNIGLAYHPPTLQMVGPWCRTYGRNQLQYTALINYYLDLGLTNGYPISSGQAGEINDETTTLVMCDLPITVRTEVNANQPYGITTFTAANYTYNGETDVNRTLIQSRQRNNLMLGIAAQQDFNTAKRNLVAFWALNSTPPGAGGAVGFCIEESNQTFNDGNSDSSTNFYSTLSTDSGKDVLVAASTWKSRTLSNANGWTASQRLTFAPGATVTSANGAKTLVVHHDTWNAYVTPVTNTTAVYSSLTDSSTNDLCVNRAWSTADYVGVSSNQAQVIAYVVSFRSSDQPAPTVSSPVLSSDGNGNITVSAKVTDPATGVTTSLALPTFTH